MSRGPLNELVDEGPTASIMNEVMGQQPGGFIGIYIVTPSLSEMRHHLPEHTVETQVSTGPAPIDDIDMGVDRPNSRGGERRRTRCER